MRTVSESIASNARFLSKADPRLPATLTIKEMVRENVAPEGQPQQFKEVCHFEEASFQPAVCGPTVLHQIEVIANTEDLDSWPGTKVEFFNDLTVTFRGNIGGLRARKPKTAPDQELIDEDVPL